MTFLDVVITAVIQALCEVLPLGASAPLAALPRLSASPEARAVLTIAINSGVALALCLYFWRDLAQMGLGAWRLLKGKRDPGANLLMLVIVGAVPGLLLGWLLERSGTILGGTPLQAALLCGGFGLLMLVSDRVSMTVRRVEHMGLLTALLIGLSQAAALFPGVSRTGITITLARILGYERQAAARFSLLLAIPVFVAHAIHLAFRLRENVQLVISADLVQAGLIALAVSLAGVALMMLWLRKHSFAPFAWLRILFAVVVVGGLVWM